MTATLLWIAVIVLILLGVAGTVLPAIPGTPLVFFGLLLAAWIDDFTKVGWLPLTFFAGLTLLSLIVDFVTTSLGAKRVGASRAAIVGAIIGMVAGLFLGLVGIFIGPFVGAFIGEYLTHQDLLQSGKVGLGTWLGLVIGMTIKLGLIFVMLGTFLLAYLF